MMKAVGVYNKTQRKGYVLIQDRETMDSRPTDVPWEYSNSHQYSFGFGSGYCEGVLYGVGPAWGESFGYGVAFARHQMTEDWNRWKINRNWWRRGKQNSWKNHRATQYKYR